MASGKRIVGVLIALTFAAVLFSPVHGAVTDNSGDVDVTNESVTADVGTYVELDGYSIKKSSETVWWYNDSSSSWEKLTEGTDYEMSYDNGSVKALSGGKASSGDELKVSYTYEATDGTTTTVLNLVPLMMALLMVGILGVEVQKRA